MVSKHAKKVSVMDWGTGGAAARGYTKEVLGVPVVPGYGRDADDVVRKRIGFGSLKWACYGRRVWDADVFIDFAHLKGHGNCGFGGAIKNIGMGTVNGQTRGAIYRLEGGIVWHAEKCIHCNKCIKECPNHANSFGKDGNYNIFFHHCTYCQHCILACQKGALELDSASTVRGLRPGAPVEYRGIPVGLVEGILLRELCVGADGAET